jgi:hypothetical protein
MRSGLAQHRRVRLTNVSQSTKEIQCEHLSAQSGVQV